MLKSVSRGLSDLPGRCCFALAGTQQLRGTLQTIIQTQVHLGLANPDFSHFCPSGAAGPRNNLQTGPKIRPNFSKPLGSASPACACFDER